MDPVTIDLAAKLVQYGPAGLLAVALIVAVKVVSHLYAKTTELHESIRAMQDTHRREVTEMQNAQRTEILRLQSEHQQTVRDLQHNHQQQMATLHVSMNELHEARLNDAQAYSDKADELHGRVHASVDQMASVVERLVPLPPPGAATTSFPHPPHQLPSPKGSKKSNG